MRITKKSLITGGVMLLSGALSAQQSFGMQNHPAPRRLKAQSLTEMPWWPEVKVITLILIGAAAVAWMSYLFTVYRMYREKQDTHPLSQSTPTAPSAVGFDIPGITGKGPGSELWGPQIAYVDHKSEEDQKELGDREEPPSRGQKVRLLSGLHS